MKIKFEEYLEHFNKVFNTKINVKEPKLFLSALDQLVDELYYPSETTIFLINKRKSILRKLTATFTEEQKRLFEQYWEKDNDIHTYIEEQLFVFAYIILKETANETIV
ncbi:MAG: hypothetical protein J6M60_06980 [Clostridia bacterium]|nr:hypothetical protein [Clostridia bacterium]